MFFLGCGLKVHYLYKNLALLTSLCLTSFGVCVLLPAIEFCFERFFFRLLVFSSQLIATNNRDTDVFTFTGVFQILDSIDKQDFGSYSRRKNKTEEHQSLTISVRQHSKMAP